MEKQLKVAYFGMKPNLDAGEQEVEDLPEWFCSIGIRSYTVGVETALDIIRNTHKGFLSQRNVPGLPNPENECEIMLGGRFFPFFSRDEIVKVVGDVDLIILSGGLQAYYARGFLMWLNPEVISDKSTIVLRMPFTEEEASGRTIAKASEMLKDMGMNEDGKIIDKKARKNLKKKLKRKETLKDRTIFTIGLEEYGGCNPEMAIPLLQSHLLQEDLVEQIIEPVKETVSAGKSLFSLGRAFTGWMSSLVKSN